jgi:hypothetical protein
MVTFIDVYEDAKKSKPALKKLELNRPKIYGVQKLTSQKTAAIRKKRQELYGKNPISLDVDIIYWGDASSAMKARNEIETLWSKHGKWIGHGSSLGGSKRSVDVQVAFKESCIPKAKKCAEKIMRKYGLSGTFNTFNLLEDE